MTKLLLLACGFGALGPSPAMADGPFTGVTAVFPHAKTQELDTLRAAAAIERRDFAGAKLILSDSAPTSRDPNVKWLAGVAYLGVNKLAIARGYFAEAIRLDRDFLGATVALAITDAHLGNRDSADRLLQGVRRRQLSCAGRCAQAAELDKAAATIGALLS